MDENKKKILDKVAKILAESGAFKGFHGNVTINIAHGEAKNFTVNQSFLPEKT